MDIIDNINIRLKEDWMRALHTGSRVSIAASCFSIYAYEELKAQLKGIDELRFIFTSPTFVTEQTDKQQREFYIPRLNRERNDCKYWVLLTKLIPQKMVFALQFGEQTQFVVYHTKLITSDWQSTEEATIPLSGFTLDSVRENIVKNIGQIEVEQGNTLAEQIADNDQRTKWLAQIATLERKMAKEKQPRRKRALFEEIKQLKQKVGTQRVALQQQSK